MTIKPETFQQSRDLSEIAGFLAVSPEGIPGLKSWTGEELYPCPNLWDVSNMAHAWHVAITILEFRAPLEMYDEWLKWLNGLLAPTDQSNPETALWGFLDKLYALCERHGLIESE